SGPVKNVTLTLISSPHSAPFPDILPLSSSSCRAASPSPESRTSTSPAGVAVHALYSLAGSPTT
ncbi:hypothetical protein V2J09_003142, partial [Rumex salicifolius]